MAASSTAASSTAAANASAETPSAVASVTFGAVPNTLAQDKDALKAVYPDRFTQVDFLDQQTGLSITCNMFLPEGYDESKSYPMVVFIADSSCAKGDAMQSLTQGLGALVWATDEWQAVNPSIVCVPTYPETILDDHNGYATTEYVEATKRVITAVSNAYAVDENRIYGTGQSMGCMTTLILASEYPDLYAAYMFVDGQWDVTTLEGLKGQAFVYFAAEDDTPAFGGLNDVMKMFEEGFTVAEYAQWDGTWTPDELTAAAQELFSKGARANFVSWKTGTISAGGSSSSASDGGAISTGGGSRGGAGGGTGGASYHMASFDYAYNCIAAMEWLFAQTKLA